jgi:hypothetical protein
MKVTRNLAVIRGRSCVFLHKRRGGGGGGGDHLKQACE